MFEWFGISGYTHMIVHLCILGLIHHFGSYAAFQVPEEEEENEESLAHADHSKNKAEA